MTCPRCTTPMDLHRHHEPAWHCPLCRTVLDLTARQQQRLQAMRRADAARLLEEAETHAARHASKVDTRAARARWARLAVTS